MSTPASSSSRSPFNDTGLHVIKGAIVRVLGKSAAVTASVKFEKPTKGSITILYDTNQSLSQETIDAIEAEANTIIAGSTPIVQKTMGRAAAEEYYTANPVNHTYIYDQFPVPAHITDLSVLEIPDINVNCCAGQHLATTGELLALKILKTNKSKNKEGQGLYEFKFSVGDDAVKAREEKSKKLAVANKGKTDSGSGSAAPLAAATSSTVKSAKSSQSQSKSGVSSTHAMPAFRGWEPGSKSRLQLATEHCVSIVQSHLSSQSAALSDATMASLSSELERVLLMYGNVSYTAGYEAASAGSHLTTQTERAKLL